MKALLILAVLVALGYFGYKSSVREAFSEKGFPQIIENANKNFPRTIQGGVVVQKLEAKPGLRVVERVTLPMLEKEMDTSRLSEASVRQLACEDIDIRYFLDHGVTLEFIVEDKTGHTVLKEIITKKDC